MRIARIGRFISTYHNKNGSSTLPCDTPIKIDKGLKKNYAHQIKNQIFVLVLVPSGYNDLA